MGGPWAIGAVVLPFVVGVVVLLAGVGGDFRPLHDIAQMEMVVRDVGRHEVLVGPYSRDGWYHPGPLVFYLLAVPYRLTGGASVGLYVGALLVNGGSVAGMAAVARRRGGPALMLVTLLACGLLVRSLGPDFVRDPWNPSITVLPFGLLLFLVWAVCCGELWALPAAAAVGSFVAQTHVGYVLLAGALLAWGLAWVVVPALRRPGGRDPDTADEPDLAEGPAAAGSDDGDPGDGDGDPRARPDRRRLARTLLVTAGVLAVAWALPLAQQAAGDPPNMGEIVDWFRSTDEPMHTLADGWRVLSTQLGWQPEWLFGSPLVALSGEPVVLYTGAHVPVALLVLVPAAVVLWRQGPGDARRLLLTLAFAAAVGVVAVARTPGLAYDYRLHWVHVLGMATGVVVGWAAVVLIRTTRAVELAPRLLPVGVAAVVAVCLVDVVDAAGAGTPQEESSEQIGEVTAELTAALPPGDGPVLVEAPTFTSLLYAPGVALQLERDGVPVRLPSLGTAAVGDHRMARGESHRAVLVVAADQDIEAVADDPTLRLVAQSGRVPPPRSDDDPVAQAEEAFLADDAEAYREIGRRYAGEVEADDVPFTAEALAVYIRTEPPTT